MKLKDTFFKGLLLSTVVPFLAIIAIVTSCEKSDDLTSQPTEESISFVEDDTYASETFEEVEDIVDEAAEELETKSTTSSIEGSIISECATITIEGDSLGTTIIVDFGEENCECEDGRYRKGKITANYTGDYWDDGIEVTYTFDDYFVDNNQITGVKTMTRVANNEDGHRESYAKVEGTIILADIEGTIKWSSELTREVIMGSNTLRRTDDVYQLSGYSSGTTRDGDDYSATITSPLVRRLDFGCRRNYVEGVLEITQTDGDEYVIDYGNGTCDRFATVTVNGLEYIVYLR